MAILKYLMRIKYIDYMIKKKATGSLKSFAQKNNLCKSAMAGVLQEMKELGFPIKFDRQKNTYYYNENGQMVQALFMREGQIQDKAEISGIGPVQDLCFSETTVFQLCKNV